MEYILKNELNINELSFLYHALKIQYKKECESILKTFKRELKKNKELPLSLQSGNIINTYEILSSEELIKISCLLSDPANIFNCGMVLCPAPSKEEIIKYLKDISIKMDSHTQILQVCFMCDLFKFVSLFDCEFMKKEKIKLKTIVEYEQTYIIKDYGIKFKIISSHKRESFNNYGNRCKGYKLKIMME